MRIGITGATGFVGRALLASLRARGHWTLALLRHEPMNGLKADRWHVLGPVEAMREPERTLEEVDAVIHLAARMPWNPERDSQALQDAVNAKGTAALAEAAARAGVRRFVFVSTAAVLGPESPPGPDGSPRAFTAEDPPAPPDAHSRSKAEGEALLKELGRRMGLEWVVVRPPLVYGPGVGGYFLWLMRQVDRGRRLALGALRNRQSLVFVETLADLLGVAVEHRAAAKGTFLVSDGEDVSTPDLVRRLAKALERPARLIPMPPALLRTGMVFVGRRTRYEQLTRSFFVDISETQRRLGWTPPVPLDEALARTAAWFKTKR